jgi:hypothetical protein
MSACHSLFQEECIYIYIETRENLTEATYMEDAIYVEKERTKEEKHGNIYI